MQWKFVEVFIQKQLPLKCANQRPPHWVHTTLLLTLLPLRPQFRAKNPQKEQIFWKSSYLAPRLIFQWWLPHKFEFFRLTLSPQEQRVNDLLMSAKLQTYDNCFDQMCFPPARHFFDAKSDIENSEVFRLIKRMPKGEMFMQTVRLARCHQAHRLLR